eukprot:TRINITY_DN10831_c0_g1_i1.p1 TRINITY_DN10831_c0_g1~~TRINITY_DN10831_c0_g1_i1.p1  ORF type:complete len:638 (+),score=156.84 TRINITY_DN10831_c0_g1_i1:70-1914(+)
MGLVGTGIAELTSAVPVRNETHIVPIRHDSIPEPVAKLITWADVSTQTMPQTSELKFDVGVQTSAELRESMSEDRELREALLANVSTASSPPREQEQQAFSPVRQPRSASKPVSLPKSQPLQREAEHEQQQLHYVQAQQQQSHVAQQMPSQRVEPSRTLYHAPVPYEVQVQSVQQPVQHPEPQVMYYAQPQAQQSQQMQMQQQTQQQERFFSPSQQPRLEPKFTTPQQQQQQQEVQPQVYYVQQPQPRWPSPPKRYTQPEVHVQDQSYQPYQQPEPRTMYYTQPEVHVQDQSYQPYQQPEPRTMYYTQPQHMQPSQRFFSPSQQPRLEPKFVAQERHYQPQMQPMEHQQPYYVQQQPRIPSPLKRYSQPEVFTTSDGSPTEPTRHSVTGFYELSDAEVSAMSTPEYIAYMRRLRDHLAEELQQFNLAEDRLRESVHRDDSTQSDFERRWAATSALHAPTALSNKQQQQAQTTSLSSSRFSTELLPKLTESRSRALSVELRSEEEAEAIATSNWEQELQLRVQAELTVRRGAQLTLQSEQRRMHCCVDGDDEAAVLQIGDVARVPLSQCSVSAVSGSSGAFVVRALSGVQWELVVHAVGEREAWVRGLLRYVSRR